jgi:hypothetical protein
MGVPVTLATTNSLAMLGAFFYNNAVNMFIYTPEEMGDEINLIYSLAFNVRTVTSVDTRPVTVLIYETDDTELNFNPIAPPSPMPSTILPPNTGGAGTYNQSVDA